MRAAWCIGLGLLIGCASAPDAIVGADVDIDLRLEGARLDAALAAIGSVARVRIGVADPAAAARRVTLRADDLTWQAAVARVASEAGCALTRVGNGLEVQPIPVVTLQGTEQPVRPLLERLAAQAGLALEIDPAVQGRRLTLDLKALPWDEALAAVVHAAGLRAARVGERIRVAIRPLDGEAPSARPRADEEAPPDDAERRVIALGHGAARGVAIDLDVVDADLRTVLAGIGEVVGVPIELEAGKEERLTVSLQRVPWREAVDVIARMTGCTEVEERPGGGLLLKGCNRLAIGFTQAPLRLVLQLLAAYGGLDLVMAAGVPVRSVTIDWRAPEYLTALEAIGRVTGLAIERRGRVIMVSARGGWGAVDLDGAPPAPPAPPEELPRLRVRARGAPLPVMLQLLAAQAGRDLLACELPAGPIDLWLDETPADEALGHLIEAARIDAALEGNLLLVRGARGGSGGAGLVATLKPPDGLGVAIALQATVVTPPGSDLPNAAVIDQQIYREGDAIRDAEGRELDQVRVVRIEAGGVRFRVGLRETLVPF